MTNKERRELLDRSRESGYTGSIVDVFQAARQGRDLISEFEAKQQGNIAVTPQQQQAGLGPAHQRGDVGASMIFPKIGPNATMTTANKGLKVNLDVKGYDDRGHLVKSYESVPPGVQSLPTGPRATTVVETPARYTDGGPKTVKRGRKRHARSIRQYAHHVEAEPAGSKSTHLMATYEGDGKYYVAPTITTDREGYRDQNFVEALAAGEVYEFKNKKRAERFAKGSWKRRRDRKLGGILSDI